MVPKTLPAILPSAIGKFTTALNSCWPSSPKVALNLAPNSPVGLLLITLITPPTVFLPKRVPWGPRRTSTLSKSKFSKICPAAVPRWTPSIITAIGASNELSSDLGGLIPLMFRLAPPDLDPKLPIITFGANPWRSDKFLMFDFSSCSVIAVIATGISWELSSILRAVTIISSIPKDSVLSASWAKEEFEVILDVTKIANPNNTYFKWFIFPPHNFQKYEFFLLLDFWVLTKLIMTIFNIISNWF